jgi:hypothetical protein
LMTFQQGSSLIRVLLSEIVFIIVSTSFVHSYLNIFWQPTVITKQRVVPWIWRYTHASVDFSMQMAFRWESLWLVWFVCCILSHFLMELVFFYNLCEDYLYQCIKMGKLVYLQNRMISKCESCLTIIDSWGYVGCLSY